MGAKGNKDRMVQTLSKDIPGLKGKNLYIL